MPYKSGKLKGQLTAAEIRKLIRAHNKLVSIKIPPKTDRDGLIALVQKHGYKIDHEKQEIKATSRPRKPNITLKQAETVTKPKPLTEEQKKKRAEAKKKKEEKVKKREGELIKAGATIQRAVAKKKQKKVEPKKPEKKDRTPYKPSLKVEVEGKKEELSIEKLIEKLEELGFKPSKNQEKKFKEWYYKRGRHVKILQVMTTDKKLTITPVYAKKDEKGKVIKGEGKGVEEMGSAYQDQAIMKTIIKKK